MAHRVSGFVCAAVLAVLSGAGDSATAADNYALDAAHAGVSFKISHAGVSYTHGRFNEVSGNFTIDAADPAKSTFAVTINPDSVDTANKRRDDHLRSPDFLNVKQFPAMNFKSTSVKAARGGLEVTGDFTLHGVTKPVTFVLDGGKTTEFPKGTQRTGYSTQFKLKRSDFGMDKMLEAIGDEVHVDISFEGTKR
jgi:polyisoprenoid-binding protein YceI